MTLCIIKDGNRILAGDGYDEVKKEEFFRILGGGIEFGETSEEALKREFQEELATDLKNIQYVTTVENLFTFEGKNGHQIIIIYRADLANKSLYQEDGIPIMDTKKKHKAFWKDISEFKEGKTILYPNGILKFI